ncbi:MAG: HD domain-containing protein [Nanoarchaeota archaeon]|nr:HD domain-containing protein [Nanoarchaeota archaeon]MBU1704422.1 HD domain-containing protein [Nanoarchaeota archaeon]
MTPKEFQRIAKTARSLDQNQGSRMHDFAHSERVAGYALWILDQFGLHEYATDVAVAALCHDLGREDDTANHTHSTQSADIARQLVHDLRIDVDLDSVIFAIEHHSDMRSPDGNSPTVQGYSIDGINPAIPAFLWDADRLDLKRASGMRVSTKRLTTKVAQEYANSERHEANYRPKTTMDFVTDCLTPSQTANVDSYQGTYIAHLPGMFEQGLLSPPRLKELGDQGNKAAARAFILSRKKKNPYVSAHRDLDYTRSYAFENKQHQAEGIVEDGCILGLALPEFGSTGFIHVKDQIPASRIREIYVKDQAALGRTKALCDQYDRKDIQVRLL